MAARSLPFSGSLFVAPLDPNLMRHAILLAICLEVQQIDTLLSTPLRGI